MQRKDEKDRRRRRKPAGSVEPNARSAGLRAPREDDDGYDPYSDYMDALGRDDYEEPCEDPWR